MFLRYLNGYSNSFIGSLPLELAGHQFLEYLNLDGSYFSGNIPAEYGTFARLNFLDLAGNMLNGPRKAKMRWRSRKFKSHVTVT